MCSLSLFFAVKTAQLLPLVKNSSNGCTDVLSIAGIFYRALYLHHFDDKNPHNLCAIIAIMIFSDLETTIGDGTKKDSLLRSSLLETEGETIFYCNSRRLSRIRNAQK